MAMIRGMCLKTLDELTDQTCKWPIADVRLPHERSGSAWLFCGKAVDQSGPVPRPYCSEHSEIAFYVKPKIVVDPKKAEGFVKRNIDLLPAVRSSSSASP